MSRPSRRHGNVIVSRARYGHNEDQLARALGITSKTMRGWAKTDRDFAQALDAALMISRDYWRKVDEDVRQRDMRELPKKLWAEVQRERNAKIDR